MGSYSTFDAPEELRTIHPPGRVAAYSKRPVIILQRRRSAHAQTQKLPRELSLHQKRIKRRNRN